METQVKKSYETPEIVVWGVTIPQICDGSPVRSAGNPNYNSFNNEEDWSN